MKQGNIERNDSRARSSRLNFEGVESKGRKGKFISQMTESLPDMEETLRYFGSNWKTIVQAVTVLGLLGAASTFSRKGRKRAGAKHRSGARAH